LELVVNTTAHIIKHNKMFPLALITSTTYWQEYTPPTISDVQGTRDKDQALNDAIVAQADVEVPLSGYDPTKFYIVPTQDGQPANPTSLTADGTITVDTTEGGMSVTPKSDGYTLGLLNWRRHCTQRFTSYPPEWRSHQIQ
jgi:hypothetical protein